MDNAQYDNGGAKHVSDEQLLKYLRNELEPSLKSDMEDQIARDPFLQEAVEGLRATSMETDYPKHSKDIELRLQQTLHKHRNKKKHKKADVPQWVLVCLVVLLLLIITAILVIREMK
jgi:lipid II:glycine glycyltransferase (peptidoglycan interpeptide bridge formation enzyme)